MLYYLICIQIAHYGLLVVHYLSQEKVSGEDMHHRNKQLRKKLLVTLKEVRLRHRRQSTQVQSSRSIFDFFGDLMEEHPWMAMLIFWFVLLMVTYVLYFL